MQPPVCPLKAYDQDGAVLPGIVRARFDVGLLTGDFVNAIVYVAAF